jgi:hypothetical protein
MEEHEGPGLEGPRKNSALHQPDQIWTFTSYERETGNVLWYRNEFGVRLGNVPYFENWPVTFKQCGVWWSMSLIPGNSKLPVWSLPGQT